MNLATDVGQAVLLDNAYASHGGLVGAWRREGQSERDRRLGDEAETASGERRSSWAPDYA